jgi:hypothetical protein
MMYGLRNAEGVTLCCIDGSSSESQYCSPCDIHAILSTGRARL